MKITSFEEFKELARRGTFVPVVQGDRRRSADAGVGVPQDCRARRLRVPARERRRRRARRPLLVSRQGSVPHPARARTARRPSSAAAPSARASAPFVDTLRGLMADFRSPFVPGLPRFTGGAVGYLGYGASSWFEPVLGDLGAGRRRRRRCRLHAVRHGAGLRSRAAPHSDHRQRAHYGRRRPRVAVPVCVREDSVPRARARAQPVARRGRQRRRRSSVTSNHTRERFEAQVRTAKEHIAAGDIYQVVLSQRFEADVDADPFTVYRALRHVNPSPYMYFIRMGGVSVVGSSPEMLVRVEGSRVETHPIAGTRPRGRNRRRGSAAGRGAEAQREGARRARDARRSRAQRRRPRLRVRLACACRSSWALERFSHVMHLTSIVEGQLARRSRSARRAGRRAFPAGTVSGAPKVRAMQIIRELEPIGPRAVRRAPSAISISPAISTSASRSARSSCRRARRTCRPAPAS